MDSKQQSTSSSVEAKSVLFNKQFWRRFFFAGLSDEIFSEDSRRVFMINLFSLVGVLFTLPLGISSLLSGKLFLAVGLLLVAVIYFGNHLYLRVTHNHVMSGRLIIYPLYLLMLGLVYFGGIEGTGHIWVYCVPAVACFINGLRKGLIEVALFTLALAVVMRLSEAGLESYQYSDALKLRVILSFLVVAFLSGIYEYSMSLYNTELHRSSQKLQYLAETDVLTGLLNRRGLQQRLLDKNATSCHLLLADVDYFKAVNDTYGHGAGDQVLCELAGLIKDLNSSHNTASRWGGEEFLIAIEGVDDKVAYNLAEALRESIAVHEFTSGDKAFHITLSIGVAAIDENTPLEMALKLADKGLYEAKHAGRNRTVCGHL